MFGDILKTTTAIKVILISRWTYFMKFSFLSNIIIDLWALVVSKLLDHQCSCCSLLIPLAALDPYHVLQIAFSHVASKAAVRQCLMSCLCSRWNHKSSDLLYDCQNRPIFFNQKLTSHTSWFIIIIIFLSLRNFFTVDIPISSAKQTLVTPLGRYTYCQYSLFTVTHPGGNLVGHCNLWRVLAVQRLNYSRMSFSPGEIG